MRGRRELERDRRFRIEAMSHTTARMEYGAAYYAEHHSPRDWESDADRMREAGFNVVRLGEFAWSRLEPSRDQFAFDWLDRAISTMQSRGIRVILGTPTAGPPAWLFNASGDEDCRQVYEEGGALWAGGRFEFGARSSLCVSHPWFIRRSVLIAETMGRHFRDHPAVFGWQIDNEIGMYGTRCYCDVCRAEFRRWLERKYQSIEQLNARLGMGFGSGEFRNFSDIPIPRRKQDLHNPGLILDSQRFFSDAHVRFVEAQATALREAGVKQPITTNVCHMVSGWTGIDNFKLFSSLDVAGFDCYPSQFATDPKPETVALLHACARSYKGGRNYWMLEQQAGSPSSMPADDPRRIRLWTWQSVAHGASLILYWHWRQHRFGGEQNWRGIVEGDGSINARFAVVAQTGRELSRLADVLLHRTYSHDAAILLTFDSEQSLFLNPPGGSFSYRAQAEAFYGAIRRAGAGADVIGNLDEAGRYRFLIVPSLRVISPQDAERIALFVSQGGTLIATYLTATQTPDHVAPDGPLPSGLTEVFGVRRVEWSGMGRSAHPPKERLGEDAAVWAGLGREGVFPVIMADATQTYSGSQWIDHLELAGAKALARFATGSPAENLPAVTEHRYGKGRAFYIATLGDAGLLNDVVNRCLSPAADKPRGDGERVEIVSAQGARGTLHFVLNHSGRKATVHLPVPMQDLISQRDFIGEIEIEAYGVMLLSAL